MKTIIVKPQEMTKKWYLIDAEGKDSPVCGRINRNHSLGTERSAAGKQQEHC